MKHILIVFGLSILALTQVNGRVGVAEVQMVPSAQSFDIHPRVVNRLLGMAAETLSITQGQCRQWYNSGKISIGKLNAAGNAYLEVFLEGQCILTILEDGIL